MTYRKGQQVTCPHCGKDSVVAVRTQMDGWTKVGEYFACALCQAKLADPAPAAAAADAHAAGPAAPGRETKLAAFLGTEKAAVKAVVADDGDRRFCRDCAHLLEHPFKVYCLLHKRDVNPMNDCERFTRRPPR